MIVLDGSAMVSREAAHAEIAAKLGFPDYYGGNLDALFDLLTEGRYKIALRNADAMLACLGAYGKKLLNTFRDAAAENDGLVFTVERMPD